MTGTTASSRNCCRALPLPVKRWQGDNSQMRQSGKIPPVRLLIQWLVCIAIACMQTSHWIATAQVEKIRAVACMTGLKTDSLCKIEDSICMGSLRFHIMGAFISVKYFYLGGCPVEIRARCWKSGSNRGIFANVEVRLDVYRSVRLHRWKCYRP